MGQEKEPGLRVVPPGARGEVFDLGDKKYGHGADYERTDNIGAPGLQFVNRVLVLGATLAREVAEEDEQKFATIARYTNYDMIERVIAGNGGSAFDKDNRTGGGILARSAALKHPDSYSFGGMFYLQALRKAFQTGFGESSAPSKAGKTRMVCGMDVTGTDLIIYTTTLDGTIEAVSVFDVLKKHLTSEAQKTGNLWEPGKTVSQIFDRDALNQAEQYCLGGFNITTPNSIAVQLKNISPDAQLEFARRTGLVDGNGMMFVGVEMRDGKKRALFLQPRYWSVSVGGELPEGDYVMEIQGGAMYSFDENALVHLQAVLQDKKLPSTHAERALTMVRGTSPTTAGSTSTA